MQRWFHEDTSHLPALTGLRGWAAFWVLLYHGWVVSGPRPIRIDLSAFSLDFTPLFSLGGAGVTIFFVLSGFLLSLPFAEWQVGLRPRPPTGRYLFRRVARVFPAYYAQLLLLLALAIWLPSESSIQDWSSLIRHLFMFFVPPPMGATPINGVWWTLPIEFSFYLVLPALAFLMRPGRWWWLLTLSLIAMWLWRFALITWLGDAPGPLRVVSSYQLPGAFDMFGIGMLAAMLHVNRDACPPWLLPRGDASRMGFLGILLVLVSVYWLSFQGRLYWANHPIFYLWTPALSLGTAAVILAIASGSRLTDRLFGNRIMIFAGLVSYSVYLWHAMLLGWIHASPAMQGIKGYHLAPLLFVSVPLVYLIATVSYLLIERPFMRMRMRRG